MSIPLQLYSAAERHRMMERVFSSHYRWYLARSQELRNWNPDVSFDWKSFGKNHSPDLLRVIEGFFAIEQYAPDYTSRILDLVRRSSGRSGFQLRWGAEEERHADAWENALYFSCSRPLKWIQDYKYGLRQRVWTLPWDDPLHMLVYTVFQERATQINYLNLASLARHPDRQDTDPVLCTLATTIAKDEAAHYSFFLDGVRLYLLYFPGETLQAILDVLQFFAMPAQNLIPEWHTVSEAIYRLGIYGPREFSKNVVSVVFANLGLKSRRQIEEGIKRSREVPDANGIFRGTTNWDYFSTGDCEESVRKLCHKLDAWNETIGLPPTQIYSA